MGQFLKNASARNALTIGTMCSFSYLCVYLCRSVLSAVTPQILEEGVFGVEQLGTISSTLFIVYAIGQLINGTIGDRIRAKYMICSGLLVAGLCTMAFPLTGGSWLSACVLSGFTGFFLAMIFGPMAKTIAENTDPLYTPRCTLGFTFASLIGTPLAGLIALFLAWRGVFWASGGFTVFMAVASFLVLHTLERQGIVRHRPYQKPEGSAGSIRVLLERQIVKFMLLSIVTGTVRTTVVFWLPTYMTQFLGLSAEQSALLYTIVTFIVSASAFLAIFLYERLGRNMDRTILLCFVVSALAFLSLYFIRQPVLNIPLLVVAIISSNCVMNMTYSIYSPSLRDTGMVSRASGLLDFVSYAAASASSSLFANAVVNWGWDNLILIWTGIIVFGILIALPRKNKAPASPV